MAINIGGMLAQSGATTGQLMGQGIANLGTGLGTGLGGMLTRRQEKRRAQSAQEQFQQILGATSNRPADMLREAQALMISNDPNLQKVGKMLENEANRIQGIQNLTSRKTAMANRATSLGLTNIAESIRNAPDQESLSSIAKDLRQAEISRLPSQTPAQRLARARSVGITKQEFDDAGLSGSTDQFFDDYVKGLKGKTEAWVDSGGNVKAVRFSEAGKAWDEKSNRFVEPSQLGLIQKAPSVQKVIDASNKMIEAIADESVKDIVTLRERATTAKGKLDVINRQLGRLEGGMPTGLAANLKVGLARVGQLFNMPYDPELVNAQEYMMEVANLVKQEIKAFGSGASITDADREYTQRMVGGDLTQQAEALENMLQIYKEAAENTINQYNGVVSGVSSKIGSDNMGTFREITMPEVGLSKNALRYITPAQES